MQSAKKHSVKRSKTQSGWQNVAISKCDEHTIYRRFVNMSTEHADIGRKINLHTYRAALQANIVLISKLKLARLTYIHYRNTCCAL